MSRRLVLSALNALCNASALCQLRQDKSAQRPVRNELFRAFAGNSYPVALGRVGMTDFDGVAQRLGRIGRFNHVDRCPSIAPEINAVDQLAKIELVHLLFQGLASLGRNGLTVALAGLYKRPAVVAIRDWKL